MQFQFEFLDLDTIASRELVNNIFVFYEPAVKS